MKKINSIVLLVLLLILVSFNIYSQQTDQWKWLNPKPQGNTIFGMDFVNDNIGYSVGAYGTIIKTTDAGASWAPVRTDFVTPLYCVNFIDENTGYIGGLGQLLKKTTNGGINWNDMQLPSDPDFYILSIQFLNNNTGYVLGFFQLESKIWKTTDAGQSWTTLPDVQADYLNKLYFMDENYGFAVGGSLGDEIVKTTDGGNTWLLLDYFNHPKLNAIHFFNQTTGIAAGEDGCVLRTDNAGATWQRVGSPSSLEVTSLLFVDDNLGFGIGTGSVCIKTTNAGLNWTEEDLGISSINSYYDGAITPNGNLHAAGTYGGIIRSLNSGSNWSTQYSVAEETLSEIYFTDNNTGYAVCGFGGGNILKTIDAGETWTSMVTGYQLPMYGIYFTDHDNGYIAGSLKIYKTTNAGVNWTTSYSSTTNEIFTDVDFVNLNTGFVIGSYGKLMKTTDAGISWTSIVVNNPGSMLTSIDFVNETVGYMTGDFGVILKTTNGGTNWELQSSPFQFVQMNSIDFEDETHGYIACGEGVLVTSDGGVNWTSANVPDGGYYKVQFKGNFGYGVSSNGIIIKTTDAGVNWIEQPTVTSNGLFALYFNSDNYVYAGGLRGTILKTIPSELLTHAGNITLQVPSGFRLSQNFPNPFNPVTKINFDIPKSAHVSLSVFDMLGKKIASIVDKELNAGNHTFDFNGNAFSSGTYFYRLETPGFTETKRMILLK